MSEPTAQRTLVKSPPELWAEVSDVESLARHLGEFGDIAITRVEPETTVVWEGERASGTVELEPSGWGTKVTLTAMPKEEAEAAEAPPEPPAAVPAPAPSVLDSWSQSPAGQEPSGETAPPAPVAAPMTASEMLAKSGFFARMMGRKKAPGPAPRADIGGPPAPTPDPAPPAPTPLPDPAPAPDPQPPAPVPDPDPLPAPTPLHPPAPDPGPPAAAEAPLDVEGVLTGVLDSLGAAHHRPFSR